jgi:spore coat polysaccharide biosynthesis protein SpsF
MKIHQPLVIIQARMGSSRLPGKSMMPINGTPLLAYLIKTILSVDSNIKIVIATSELPENDIIRSFAKEYNIDCVSGSETNVASRFVKILEANPSFGYFIRLCGDSPFFDVDLLKKGIDIMNGLEEYDIITSKYVEGYPMGSNLEIIKSSLYIDSFKSFNSPEQFEHVTPYFYKDIDKYHCHIIQCLDPNSNDPNFKLSVDTKEDFEKAVFMLAQMNYEPWEYSLEEKFNYIKVYLNR